MMSASGKLMTFLVGGPRCFENNTVMEIFNKWNSVNLSNVHHEHLIEVYRDCPRVYGSPLFRMHYEYLTNLQMRPDVMEREWWFRDHQSDPFQDADNNGYVATQLSHLPKMTGYDPGNLLFYLSLYNVNGQEICSKSRITSRNVHECFFYETKHKQFKDRSNSVAVAQRDFLNDPSIYVVNRKSFCMNKPQIFYNSDLLNLMCVALMANLLKWSEGFLGNGMMYYFRCKYEEPLRSIAMDFDFPKIAIFDLGRGHYSCSPPSSLPRKRLSFSPPDTNSGEPLSKMAYDYRFVNNEIRGLLVGKKKVCPEGLFIKELPASVTEDPPRSYHLPRVYEWANSKKDENDVGWSDIMSEIWHSSANCPMEMVNGEVMLLNGLFGSCFVVEPSVERRHATIGRMRNQFDFHQRIGGAYVERNQCLLHHAIKMPIILFNTINGPFMFPIPGNLNGAYFS